MGRKHLFIMVLCCMIPVAGLLAIRLFSIPVSTPVFFGLMLLCPISHVVLMKLLMDNHSHAGEGAHAAHHDHADHAPALPDRQA